eukprot:2996141-Ditylum_brightwellii.AAC.1
MRVKSSRNKLRAYRTKWRKKTWSGLANDHGHQLHYSQQELNAIIGMSVKAALKKECKDRVKKEEHHAIDEFDVLSLSS